MASASDDLRRRNLDILREDVADRRTRFRALPPVVSLHTSEHCNLQCVMCERGIIPGRLRLPRPVLRSVCEELFPTAVRVYAGGFLGEPLLGDFDVIADSALRHGTVVDLVTNGTLLTRERYVEWRGALARVNVSMDSHVPETYARIRKGGRFDQVVSNLQAIGEERQARPDGVQFSISAIVMTENLQELAGFVRFAASIGADRVEFQVLRHFPRPFPWLDPFGGYGVLEDRAGGRPAVASRMRNAPPEIHRVHGEVLAAARASRIDVSFGDFGAPPVLARLGEKPPDPVSSWKDGCWSVALNFGVFPTGDVYPCCHPTDLLLGNIHDDAVRDIWNGRVAQELRRRHFARIQTPFCSGCVQAPYLPATPPSSLHSLSQRLRLGLRRLTNGYRRWRRRSAAPSMNADRSRSHAP